MKLQKYAIVLAAMFLAAGTASAIVEIEMVTIFDPGNAPILEPAPDWQMGERWVGDVDYVYNIGKTEVTAAQYTEFLNAVAATDTYTLWDSRMMSPLDPTNPGHCKIEQFGVSGSFTYVANKPDVPVNWVDLGDAIRFVNWLHNGQPTGAQDLTTTEDGTYFLNGGTTAAAMQGAIIAGRAPDALFHLPSESEWIKAARYDRGTATYFDYATSSNIMPTAEAPPGGSNSANYNKVAGVNGSLYDVGAYVASVSPYGTFDQNGSVVEFCDSTYPKLYSSPGSVLLGGSLASANFNTLVFRNPQNESHTYGFRVTTPAAGLYGPGDFDHDYDVDDADIDMLCDFIRLGLPYDAEYDISADGTSEGTDGFIDLLDLDYHVRSLVETAIGNGTEYGDFNLDGMIDTTDLTRLATNYGPDDWKWDDGNANRYIDTDIDNTDLTILATYYGFVASVDAIPEPATLSLLALGGVALFRRKRP